MVTTPSKQIIKFLSAPIRLTGISVSGSSADISTAIATALSTAGDGGVAVPTQVVGGSNKVGIITLAPSNRCEIALSTSKDKILALNGEEIFARLSEAGGIYTLSFLTLPDTGTETAHSFASAATIDVEFNYRFDFNRLPSDAIIAIGTRNINQDSAVGGGGSKLFRERLTIATQNTVPVLAKTPDQAYNLVLIINGLEYSTLGGGSAPMSVSGKTVTWSASNAGFNLDTTDKVDASYTTLE
ncbi:MAG: hypothetical protein HC781_06385 [Leptolyngbyaceae cyanobacterium CSU_1_4]|nr:hypothetical protein [Leptolyngbyaceae cyanobacterium CSU_1_4]